MKLTLQTLGSPNSKSRSSLRLVEVDLKTISNAQWITVHPDNKMYYPYCLEIIYGEHDYSLAVVEPLNVLLLLYYLFGEANG